MLCPFFYWATPLRYCLPYPERLVNHNCEDRPVVLPNFCKIYYMSSAFWLIVVHILIILLGRLTQGLLNNSATLDLPSRVSLPMPLTLAETLRMLRPLMKNFFVQLTLRKQHPHILFLCSQNFVSLKATGP